MSIKQARIAAAVALALSSSVTLANVYQEFQRGFYVGINSGASFVTGQTYNQISKGEDFVGPFRNTTTTFRDEDSARGYNGGLSLGWNFYSDREYIYTVEISGNVYSNRAFQTFWTEGRQLGGGGTDTDAAGHLQNFEESWKMTYSGELTFKPGWFVSDSTQLYAILGGSVAQVKDKLKNLEGRREGRPRQDGDDRRHHDNDSDDSNTIYGFVLGVGAQKQLCNRLSVFTSYEYTYFGRTSFDNLRLDRRGEGDNGLRQECEDRERADVLHDRKLRIDTNVFKLGLLYTF